MIQYLVNILENNGLRCICRRGALIVRRLCVLLGAEKVYREFSTILESEVDLDFASVMVQVLNLILLTSTELGELRSPLKKSLVDSCGKDLFQSLYASWRHSPMATISLCLLAQAYNHASCVIQSLGEEDINVNFLVQLDKLIRLLETPVFAYLRLQVTWSDNPFLQIYLSVSQAHLNSETWRVLPGFFNLISSATLMA
ncbi:Protein VAC14-like protein [Zea mays]|nr:Protein VAC14-like protein [Zea mays]AQL08543.1 Protein VAC14-like protein [Zea mays]